MVCGTFFYVACRELLLSGFWNLLLDGFWIFRSLLGYPFRWFFVSLFLARFLGDVAGFFDII